MILPWTNRRRTIGLDIGRDTIKVAQVVPGDKSLRLDGVALIRRTSQSSILGADEVEMLARVMERRGMMANQAVLIAPTNALVSASINLPTADADASRDKIVEMELSRMQGLAVGGFEYAWWDLPPSSGAGRQVQAHAIALPHDAMMPTIQSLGTLGIETRRTVPTSLALMATARHIPVDASRISAILDLGSQRTHLCLMYADRVVHERALVDFNLAAIHGELAESLQLDSVTTHQALAHYGLSDVPEGNVATQTTSVLSSAIEPLAEEIGMSFAYVSHMYPHADLGRLLLVGGGANMRGLGHRLNAILELDVTVLTPGQVLESSAFGMESADPSLTAAVGAAMLGEQGI